MELNDKIISLPSFLCKICEKFLSRPIMLVATLGNVCHSCITDKDIIMVHNAALEEVLDMLLIKCPYYGEGCTYKLPYSELSSHKSTCSYRYHYCPLKLFTNCDWEGRLGDLLEHGSSCHQDFVLTNEMKLELDITKDNDVLKLLHIGNNMFILHIKFMLESLKQYYVVYFIGSEENSQLLYQIIQTKCNGLKSINLGSSQTLQDIEYKGAIHKNAFVVDLSLIKPLIGDKTMSIQIKIILNERIELQTDMLSNFECPVCKNYMRPPIYQCLSGHSVCSQCRSKIPQCPTCRSSFGATRNFSLESISANFKFPCTHHYVGCRKVLKHTDLYDHESQCPLKPYPCPLTESARCVWTGTLTNITNHLKLEHIEKLIFASYMKVTIPFSLNTNYFSVCCMIANENIFRVCCKYDMYAQNSYWAVQLIGPQGRGKNFRSEIGLIDGQNDHRRLVRVDLVKDFSNLDSVFNQCLVMPFSTVSGFNHNDQLSYYCKITQIK